MQNKRSSNAIPPSLSALRSRLISHAIHMPEFRSALDAAAAAIRYQSAGAPNEATVEGIFERELYWVLREIGLPFQPVKEGGVALERYTTRGRTDSRLGAVVIEYKQPSTLSGHAAEQAANDQLCDYVKAISSDTESEIVGFLTDGLRIQEVRASDGNVISSSALRDLDQTNLMWLVQALVALENSALTSDNLIRDFCGANCDGIVFRVAASLYEVLSTRCTVKTMMLRTEWEELFRLAHEDHSNQSRIISRRDVLAKIFSQDIRDAASEYSALFSLHTAYAIILKFIAYRIVSDVKFGTPLVEFKSLATATSDDLRSRCDDLEDGELFRQVGILNLLEGDFFAWYADRRQWDDKIAAGVREIIGVLSRYEDVKNIYGKAQAVDLFRSLYEATVPQVVRASFGEFYTPQWLAEAVLRDSVDGEGWNVLDPCCGSGTFLIAAISRVRSELQGKPPTQIAAAILHRVFGIDLNPLAVLTARVHYFIHIADLLDDSPDSAIVIPVFLGDASNVPTHVTEAGVDFLYYELKTLKTPLTVFVPSEMARDYEAFIRLMCEFEGHVKFGRFEIAKNLVASATIAQTTESLALEKMEALADQIIELDKKDWNGIWARIIANFIATAQIGPFSNIVGNPPWIDWKSLPSGYRDKIKALCIEKGLFSGAGRTGGINLNICALIAHVSATNWLGTDGRLAFLMPRELIYQASYEGWRTAIGGASCSLTKVVDWSAAGHPFDPVKEDFMTFVFVRQALSQEQIPVTVYTKKSRRTRASQWSNYDEAVGNLVAEARVAGRIRPGRSAYTIASDALELAEFKLAAGSCSYIGREGVEFYPQEFQLFEYVSPGPKPGTAFVRNLQFAKSKEKIAQHTVLLETVFLFPLCKGPNIGRFTHTDGGILVAFPYEENNPHAPISRDRLLELSPNLLKYYDTHRAQLEKQTAYSDAIRGAGEYYGLARTGPYSFKSCYVAFRDNTKWCAAVVGLGQTPWGEAKRYVFQNHAVSMCERSDGGFISKVEAHFVAGILNTPVVRRFIYASSDNRSFNIRPPVYLPLFDPNDSRHVRIAALAQEAASSAGADVKDEVLVKIETVYLEFCAEREM